MNAFNKRKWDKGVVHIKDFVSDNVAKTEAMPSRKVCVYTISSKDDLTTTFKRNYSRMKYSDPEATWYHASKLARKLLEDSYIKSLARIGETIILTSSAFGEVPTAANAIMVDVAEILKEKGVNIKTIKIDRGGDFETTHYGKMSTNERLERIKKREITISKESRRIIRDRFVVVIDDVNVTGSHEVSLDQILKTTSSKGWSFCYLVDFSSDLAKREPQTEEILNHAAIKTTLDLIPVFRDESSDKELRVNARTIKYILIIDKENDGDIESANKIENLNTFLMNCGDKALMKFFHAAYSADGYHNNPRFVNGFNLLMNQVLSRGLLDINTANHVKEYTVIRNVTVDHDDNIVCMDTGENLNWLAKAYSKMKFGDRDAVKCFGKLIADKYIARLEDSKDSLLKFYKGVKERGEHIVMVSPASRNIEAPANFVAEVAIKRINLWLTLNNLPTIIIMKLNRLVSSVPTYASATAEERKKIQSVVRALLPDKDFSERKIHVIFMDDVRITGLTADKYERSILANGALSFTSLYCLRVNPQVSSYRPEIEDVLNHFLIKGELNDYVAEILNHDDFHHVQRVMRLVINKKNRDKVEDFFRNKLNNKTLKEFYEMALGNNFLHDQKYRDSLLILKKVLQEKGLVDDKGLLVE